jgi:hypothetical protein
MRASSSGGRKTHFELSKKQNNCSSSTAVMIDCLTISVRCLRPDNKAKHQAC